MSAISPPANPFPQCNDLRCIEGVLVDEQRGQPRQFGSRSNATVNALLAPSDTVNGIGVAEILIISRDLVRPSRNSNLAYGSQKRANPS
jgi:hypothetical protein